MKRRFPSTGHRGTIIYSNAEKTRVTVTSKIFMDQLPAALSSVGWYRASGAGLRVYVSSVAAIHFAAGIGRRRRQQG